METTSNSQKGLHSVQPESRTPGTLTPQSHSWGPHPSCRILCSLSAIPCHLGPPNPGDTSAPESFAGREVHPPASSPAHSGMRSGAAPPSQRGCPRTPPAPRTPSAPRSPNLVGDSLGLGRGGLRGGRRSAHHLGGRRGGSVRTQGGGHAGAADTRGSGRAESCDVLTCVNLNYVLT